MENPDVRPCFIVDCNIARECFESPKCIVRIVNIARCQMPLFPRQMTQISSSCLKTLTLQLILYKHKVKVFYSRHFVITFISEESNGRGKSCSYVQTFDK